MLFDDFDVRRRWCLNGNAFGQGRTVKMGVSPVKLRLHGIKHRRLRANDLNVGLHRLRRDGHPRNEPATADGNNDDIKIGAILNHFDRHGPLPCGDDWVVKGVNERQPITRCEVHGELHAVVKPCAMLNDRRPKIFGVLHLIEWCSFGHHDGAGDPKAGGMVGDPLRMVARTTCDHTRLFLRVRQRQQLGQRPTRFERIRMLAIFELEVQINPQLQRQSRRGHRRRADGVGGDGFVGVADEVWGDGGHVGAPGLCWLNVGHGRLPRNEKRPACGSRAF